MTSAASVANLRWVARSAGEPIDASITERPIGDDPEVPRSLNPEVDISEAYATVHVLMPDGSMRLGGEAVAEILRRLPNTRWFAGLFSVRVLGCRPFQSILKMGYAVPFGDTARVRVRELRYACHLAETAPLGNQAGESRIERKPVPEFECALHSASIL